MGVCRLLHALFLVKLPCLAHYNLHRRILSSEYKLRARRLLCTSVTLEDMAQKHDAAAAAPVKARMGEFLGFLKVRDGTFPRAVPC